MIINATGLTGIVQTMFTTFLVILIIVADITVFLGAVRRSRGESPSPYDNYLMVLFLQKKQ